MSASYAVIHHEAKAPVLFFIAPVFFNAVAADGRYISHLIMGPSEMCIMIDGCLL